MLFVVAFLLLTGPCMVASQQIDISSVSAFLDAEKWSQISNRSSIQCKWTVYTNESATQEEASFSMETIYETLHDARMASTDRTGSRLVGTDIGMVESHNMDSKVVVPETSPGGRSVTVFGFDIHFHFSVEGMLCAEMLLANKRINVVLPFQEGLEQNYLRRHNTEALERLYRGALFLIPPAETIAIFHDKKVFAEWMASNNMEYLLPTVYKTIAEVAYPAVIKATTSTGGHDVVVVRSRYHLDAELRRFDGHPYMIEEAISGEIEVFCL